MADDERPDVEYLDIGRPRGRTARRGLWLLLAAAVVAGGLTVRLHHSHAPLAAPSNGPSSSPSSRIAPGPRRSTGAAVTVTGLGAALPGETGAWNLFGRGAGVLIRIDFAHGKITRTMVPQLDSSGPVSFVATGGEVFIRPVDLVPGYAVSDGRPARPMPRALGGGPIFPGPRAGRIWTETGGNRRPTLALTALDGHRTGPVIRLPAGSSSLSAVPDGAGYLLVGTSAGVYRARPGRVRRVSTGSLLGTGPTGWLVAECAHHRGCRTILIDRRTGQRRVVRPPVAPDSPPGAAVISPDGRTAALLDMIHGHAALRLLDLRTGVQRTVARTADPTVGTGALAWSPDSRWLFALDRRGRLIVVARTTGEVRRFPAALPPLTQLTVRRGGRHRHDAR